MAREQTHSAQPARKTSGQAGKEQRSAQAGKEQKSKGPYPQSPAHVQKFLGGLDYPVNKRELVEKAKKDGADKEVMTILNRLPEREYGSPVAVSREIGKLI